MPARSQRSRSWATHQLRSSRADQTGQSGDASIACTSDQAEPKDVLSSGGSRPTSAMASFAVGTSVSWSSASTYGLALVSSTPLWAGKGPSATNL